MVACKVSWCCAVARAESQFCAIHQMHEKIHPEPLADGESFAYQPPDMSAKADEKPRPNRKCRSCHGSGECEDCDGQGEHHCHVINCYDSHECRTCSGTGECEECNGTGGSWQEIDQSGVVMPWGRTPKPAHLLSEFYTGSDEDAAGRYLRFALCPAIPVEVQ